MFDAKKLAGAAVPNIGPPWCHISSIVGERTHDEGGWVNRGSPYDDWCVICVLGTPKTSFRRFDSHIEVWGWSARSAGKVSPKLLRNRR
jgi:hypothetical protein